MSRQARILVYLANGVQGGAVVRQAVQRGYSVRALVRDLHKGASLRSLGTEIVTGDLNNAASLRSAHDGVDYVVLQIPPGSPLLTETFMTNALEAIRSAGVRGVVVKMASTRPDMPTSEPSFLANEMIESRIRESGIPFSIIRPTLYLDNLLKPDTREDIRRHNLIVYPLPEAQRVAWTSVDDAAAVALTLIDNRALGGDHRICSTEALDGAGLAHAFSLALERPVTFRSLPLDTLEQQLDALMGAGAGKCISSRLRFFESQPEQANRMLAATFLPAPELKGFSPTSIQQWLTKRAGLFSAS